MMTKINKKHEFSKNNESLLEPEMKNEGSANGATLSYCQERLNNLGITKEENLILSLQSDIQTPTFAPAKDDNIVINYVYENGQKMQYERYREEDTTLGNNTFKEYFTRKRLKNPATDNKYWQPAKSGVKPFLNGLYQYFILPNKLDTIQTLCLVEGEFKAFAGCKNGIACIGIGGIQNFGKTQKDEQGKTIEVELLADIQVCIKLMPNLKNLVILHDADCLNPSKDGTVNRQIAFYSSLKNFHLATKDLKLNVLYAHINTTFQDKAKGLDDLLEWANANGCINDILLNYNVLQTGEFFNFLPLNTDFQVKKLWKYFGLNKQENENTSNIPVIVTEKGTYIVNSKGNITQIADFSMTLLYQLATDNVKECQWIMQISRNGKDRYLVLDNKEITKNATFEEALYREQLSIDADEKQCKQLRKYLISNGVEKAETINELGYHAKSNLFFWANKAFDLTTKKILNPNELGIIEHDTGTYYMPYIEEEKVADEAKKTFRYEESEITFDEIADFVVKNWGEGGILPLCFFLSSLFADYIITANSSINAFFPIPFLAGPGGTGKSMLNKVLMNFYAKGFGEMSMSSSSTTSSMTETLSSFSNVVIHLEDYNKSTNLEGLSNFLTDFWGRRFKQKMDMNNRGAIKIHKALSTLTVSSNIPPLDADGSGAFPSRVVYQSLTTDSRPSAQKVAFQNELDKLTSQSWTKATCSLLAHRQVIIENFTKYYNELSTRVSERLISAEFKIKDRVLNNYCVLGAVYEILVSKNIIKNIIGNSFCIDNIIYDSIVKQHRSLIEKPPIQVFWDLFQIGINRFNYAYSNRAEWIDKDGNLKVANIPYRPEYIIPNCHYEFKDNYTQGKAKMIDAKVVILKLADTYDYYLKQCKSLGIKPMTDTTFKEQLREHRSYDKTTVHDSKGKEREVSSLSSWRFDIADGQSSSAVQKAYALRLDYLEQDFGLEF
jgi:hypothetical protein